MPDDIIFYFDFLSPYAYLGSVGVERLARRIGCGVSWRPLLLGVTVLKVMGLKALADTPLKRDYVRHDVQRLARYLNIPFDRALEHSMSPLAAARAFVWLDDLDPTIARAFGQAVFRSQWAEARDMSSAEAVCQLAPSLGLEVETMKAAIGAEAVKARLKQRVDEAIAAGVFGAPTFVVRGEVFWGVDRLPMVERWLETGGW